MLHFKKFILSLSAIGFGFIIVFVSALSVAGAEIKVDTLAEEVKEIDLEKLATDSADSEEMEATDSAEQEIADGEVDYYLPYPGILPDHPLYWLKMIRDRLILTFTKKPLDRAERLHLYADKRIGAAKALIEGNKVELGITTATKAEKYLDQAIDLFASQGSEVTYELKQKIIRSIQKHEELLNEFLTRVPEPAKPVIEEMINTRTQKLDTIKNLSN